MRKKGNVLKYPRKSTVSFYGELQKVRKKLVTSISAELSATKCGEPCAAKRVESSRVELFAAIFGSMLKLPTIWCHLFLRVELQFRCLLEDLRPHTQVNILNKFSHSSEYFE